MSTDPTPTLARLRELAADVVTEFPKATLFRVPRLVAVCAEEEHSIHSLGRSDARLIAALLTHAPALLAVAEAAQKLAASDELDARQDTGGVRASGAVDELDAALTALAQVRL